MNSRSLGLSQVEGCFDFNDDKEKGGQKIVLPETDDEDDFLVKSETVTEFKCVFYMKI